MAEYGSTHFQKPQDWTKTVLNGKTCQLSQKNSIGFYLALATISFSGFKVQSQDLCEGSRVLTEVKIFKDWTFVVHVNSRKVAKETVGVFELGAS